MLKNSERNANGYRIFSKNDLVWMESITRLKETGMPLKQIFTYADLRDQGEHTATNRMQLFSCYGMLHPTGECYLPIHISRISGPTAPDILPTS